MAIGAYFSPASMNTQQYDEAIKRLEQAGAGAPKGRLHHAAFGAPDKLMVFDIWDSPEDFEAFGAILMPILQEIGIDAGQPEVMSIHNTIQG